MLHNICNVLPFAFARATRRELCLHRFLTNATKLTKRVSRLEKIITFVFKIFKITEVKKMKKIFKGCLISILIFVLVVIVVIIVAFGRMTKNMNTEMDNLTNVEIDMNNVKDGVYIGKSETSLVKVEVEVTVENGKMTNIDIIKHENGKGEPANVIVDDMVEKNTYDVDGVSGATTSSEVIKNAVNNALLKGVE